jgi:hypothetical protein
MSTERAGPFINRRRSLTYATGAAATLLVLVWVGGRWMKTDLAARVRSDFERHAGQRIDLALSPATAISLMSSFAESVKHPTEGATPYDDTLLFEYGVFDWGHGENFDLKITRQVVFAGGSPAEADDHIVQVSITHRYEPGPFRQFGIVTQWGCLLPAGKAIAQFAESTPGYQAAVHRSAREVTLYASTQ